MTPELSVKVEQEYPLERLTTVRTGGPAEFFARPQTREQILELLRWAYEDELAIAVVGSGSNLLVADEGVRGIVLKLDGELSKIEEQGEQLVCGGGARLPAVAAKAARAGLSGIEFGVNIPGTVGGAVRMNANAYGGELGKVLESVEIATADGITSRSPEQFEFVYRNSNIADNEIVIEATFKLELASPEGVKETLNEMRTRRHEAQPSGIKTFGSTFKNPESEAAGGKTAGLLLEGADCRGLKVGGAQFSSKHANFVENPGDATTMDILALMAEGRRRVFERYGVILEPEVQLLGNVIFPDNWELEA